MIQRICIKIGKAKSKGILFIKQRVLHPVMNRIIPRMEERLRMDTAWVDSLTYDTIVEKKYMHYLPDDVILRAFKELNYSQYMIKSERLVPQKFTLYFAGKADTLPVLKGLNFEDKDAFIIEKNQRNDTIHYWVKDSLLYKQDTLLLALPIFLQIR